LLKNSSVKQTKNSLYHLFHDTELVPYVSSFINTLINQDWSSTCPHLIPTINKYRA
jgi:hypothetical protein